MADRRKRSPAVRFFRRNGLYIIIVCVLLLVVGAVFAVVGQVKRLSPVKQEAPSQSASETAQQPAQEQTASDASAETGNEETPEEAADESVYAPPFAGKTVLLADGKLVMTFDGQQLTMKETDGLTSLTDTEGLKTARLDVQKLQADVSLFKQSELERICIGVVQAYYYLAPETKDFTVTDGGWSGDCFAATVNAPAYDTEAPVTARVALWKLDGKSWCVSAICPEGEDGSTVFAAFSSIEPLGGKQLAEETP